MSEAEPPRFADDEGHPVAREGLRSLREERAPESSVKATLEVLRQREAAARPNAGATTFVVWAVVGAAIAGAVVYFLFFS